MATNVRGRSGSRSTGGSYNYDTWGPGTSGKTNPHQKTKRSTATHTPPPKWRQVCDNFAGKVSSYKTLYNQTYGTAQFTRPTPQTLNTFANWVNKGAVIQTCTTAQLTKWAHTTNVKFNNRQATTTSCRNVLNKKWGKNTIKAIARSKSGTYMVATSPTWKGKNFCFPK